MGVADAEAARHLAALKRETRGVIGKTKTLHTEADAWHMAVQEKQRVE